MGDWGEIGENGVVMANISHEIRTPMNGERGRGEKVCGEGE